MTSSPGVLSELRQRLSAKRLFRRQFPASRVNISGENSAVQERIEENPNMYEMQERAFPGANSTLQRGTDRDFYNTQQYAFPEEDSGQLSRRGGYSA
jgi:hypothetical protein